MRFQPIIQADEGLPLVQCAFPNSSVLSCQPVLSGKVASTYRIKIEGRDEDCCLKIASNGEAVKEARLYPLLRQKVRVPELLQAGKHATLTRWLSGMTMEEALKTADSDRRRELAFSAGETLARLHTINPGSFGYIYDGKPGYPSAPAFLSGTLEKLFSSPLVREGLGLVSLGELTAFCEANVSCFDGESCLLHGDFKANNIYVDGGEVSAVLDFGEAYAGLNIWDFGKFFRHVTDVYPDMKRPFINGYRRCRELGPDYERKVRIFDVFTVLLTIERLMRTGAPDQEKIIHLRKYTEILKENLYLVKP